MTKASKARLLEQIQLMYSSSILHSISSTVSNVSRFIQEEITLLPLVQWGNLEWLVGGPVLGPLVTSPMTGMAAPIKEAVTTPEGAGYYSGKAVPPG